MRWSAWPALVALSCSGSLAGVRLARPFFCDDPLMLALLFVVGPALLILLLGTLRRPLGMLAALLMPVVWLYIASRPADPAWPWAIPLACGGLIIVIGRASQDQPTPRPVTLAALALAVALAAWPVPGRPPAGAPARPRALFVAVEGVGWDILEGSSRAGRLSHLARLQSGGRRSPLRVPPALDPRRAWCAVASGVWPEEDDAGGHARTDGCRAGRVWDESRRAGLATGVCGWPDPQPARATLGPADFVLAEPRLPDGWLDAVASGARLSSLRAMAADRIGLLRRPRNPSEQAAASRARLWMLAADACAEMMRARQPDFTSVLFRRSDGEGAAGAAASSSNREAAGGAGAGEPAGGSATDALASRFDRALGKLIAATPAEAAIVVVAIPDRLGAGEDRPAGFCLVAGPDAHGAGPDAHAAGPAAGATPPADSAGVLSIAPALANLLGLPPPPWRSRDYTGSQ